MADIGSTLSALRHDRCTIRRLVLWCSLNVPPSPGRAENYNLTQPIRHVTNEKPTPMQWATIASEHPSALVDSCLTGLAVTTGPMTRRFV